MPELFFNEETFNEFTKFKQIVKFLNTDALPPAVTIAGGYIHFEQDYIKIRCKVETTTTYGVYFLHDFALKSVCVTNDNPSLVV